MGRRAGHARNRTARPSTSPNGGATMLWSDTRRLTALGKPAEVATAMCSLVDGPLPPVSKLISVWPTNSPWMKLSARPVSMQMPPLGMRVTAVVTRRVPGSAVSLSAVREMGEKPRPARCRRQQCGRPVPSRLPLARRRGAACPHVPRLVVTVAPSLRKPPIPSFRRAAIGVAIRSLLAAACPR